MTESKSSYSPFDRLADAVKLGRQRAESGAADRLGGLTPEQIARIERMAAKMPPGVLQQALNGAFSKLDPATLGQIADKLDETGSKPPANRRTDPTTLAVLAATAMKGRSGGVAGLLMILAGSAIANRDHVRPATAQARASVVSVGKQLVGTLANVAGRAADARGHSATSRVQTGTATFHDLAALARSPLARRVMNELGPEILKRGKRA